LVFVAWRTYGALDRETQAQVRFFAERLLDEIEAELADLVRREENRAVDEYRFTLVQGAARFNLLWPGCRLRLSSWDISRIIRTVPSKPRW
jgi:hypothetical protein